MFHLLSNNKPTKLGAEKERLSYKLGEIVMARERRRRRGGDDSDAQEIPKAPAYIKRKIPHYSILSDDDLSIIEENADTILEEIGIVFSEDQEALDILEKAGASVDGERVRFPKGMCRKLIQDNAPKQFTQFARNPERNVEIGGDNMVLVPAYGPPFVHDLSLIHISEPTRPY